MILFYVLKLSYKNFTLYIYKNNIHTQNKMITYNNKTQNRIEMTSPSDDVIINNCKTKAITMYDGEVLSIYNCKDIEIVNVEGFKQLVICNCTISSLDLDVQDITIVDSKINSINPSSATNIRLLNTTIKNENYENEDVVQRF